MFFLDEAKAAKFKVEVDRVMKQLEENYEPVPLDGLLLPEQSTELQDSLQNLQAWWS